MPRRTQDDRRSAAVRVADDLFARCRSCGSGLLTCAPRRDLRRQLCGYFEARATTRFDVQTRHARLDAGRNRVFAGGCHAPGFGSVRPR